MAIRLAFFDCDGTLTKVKSSWEYVHRKLNIWDEKADHYQALFRAGKINYHEFCRRDALLWRGLPVDRVTEILKDIPYQNGCRETIRALQEKNIQTVIVSTGLSLLIDRVREELGIDMAFANDLLSDNGYLTGEIRINVDFNKKGLLVEKTLAHMGMARDESCAVGDGEGDMGMFNAVGLSIAFCPEGIIPGTIQHVVKNQSLLDVARIVGEHDA
ncbi:MAG: Phosphoserine phosphatase [Syntrophorhabdus sp. PtaU1.Bin050]|nr:MAG: Phosphoserine phosphatase [Syntrophorhabdus sp. PtaU1.Bin050]